LVLSQLNDLADALGTQFQPFFIFSSKVRMLSALNSAVYASEENVTSTCCLDGLYLVKK